MWLGDVAYVDSPKDFSPMDPEYIKQRLQMTKDAKGYAKLAEVSKIIGVWDDHDFGTNDGGKHFQFKSRNRDIWLDFIGEPSDTDRRLQADSPIH